MLIQLRSLFGIMFSFIVATPALADIALEAESAKIVAPFKVFANATASGGKVVAKPAGQTGRGKAIFSLKMTARQTFTLKARVYAPNAKNNSFLVQVNSGAKELFELPLADAWQIATFSRKITLEAGSQTLTIYSDDPDTGLDRIELVGETSTTPPPPPMTTTQTRALWIWNSRDVLRNSAEADQLVNLSRGSAITDLFFYLVASDYKTYETSLRSLNARLKAAGIRSWGLEGYRGYFSDADGPQGLYAAAQALIDFNKTALANERFEGFHSDMEPQDGQGSEFRVSFHNGLADSQLNASSGGVWYASQVQDREMLMRDWLSIHAILRGMLHGAGLKFGAAMPSWCDDYFGEEVKVTYNGLRQGVMKHMMTLLDDYVVMSYNTNTTNAANRVVGELAYADTLPAASRPRVFAAVETHVGPGATVSYGDHATKNTRAAVLSDIEAIKSLLGRYASFAGVDIHDWVGWRDLKP